jgi:hypothetical protein
MALQLLQLKVHSQSSFSFFTFFFLVWFVL